MMLTMTSRSSRFFVVLLHLVGVSTHLPSSSYFSGGIVGVHPLSIVLETLDPASLLSSSSSSSNTDTISPLDNSLRIRQSQHSHSQPHTHHQHCWVQDASDPRSFCLDPMGGFSECGDATLWRVIPKQSTRRQAKWRKWITWATEEEETEENTSSRRIQGYALQLVDEHHVQYHYDAEEEEESSSYDYYDLPPSNHLSSTEQDLAEKECLTRRRKDNQLVLAPCSQDRAWAWQFNEHGILHFQKPKSSSSSSSTGNSQSSSSSSSSSSVLHSDNTNKRLLKSGKKTLECLGRNQTHAILLPCDGQIPPDPTDIPESPGEGRVLQIALVRQVTISSISSATSVEGAKAATESTDSSSNRIERGEDSADSPDHQHLPPSRKDSARSHASDPSELAELKTSRRKITLSGKPTSAAPSTSSTSLPLLFFKDTNPILLANNGRSLPKKEDLGKNSRLPSSDKGPTGPPSSSSSTTMKPMIRKIQMSPYIANSQDELWTDPQTGLIYHTDLCKYLGHERSDVGRHTLTGVGQFMKTVFNIKVYGVALYVSKRDVLADPVMERYASMASEELRDRPEFFETLRFMTSSSSHEHAGTFDRTVFLKTNMQLATDTMRSSLHADWKMLTQAAKDLLIGSSMKPRPASDTMMKVIQSPDNPSKCSCAQVAAEEYGADPACCARGTELVFTWRKNGHLEVRLNGDFMDTFDRSDIAEAIFFEYLRIDDPMSVDFLDHAVEGFPMLLGPLSQVPGVSSPAMTNTASTTNSQKAGGNHLVFRALEGVSGALSSGANNVAGFVHNGATEISHGALNAARTMGGAARNLGEEVDRRKDLIGKHVTHFAQQTMSSIYSGKDQKSVSTFPMWLETMPWEIPVQLTNKRATNAPRGRIFKSTLSRFFGMPEEPSMGAAPDEIVPMIHPSANSTQRLFLGMVHLYLLLILIVSFPANLTTRTKLVLIRKSKLGGIVQPISDTDSDEGSTECAPIVKTDNKAIAQKKNGANRVFPLFPPRTT